MLPYFKVNIKLQESRQSVQEEGLPDDRSSTGQQQRHRNTPTVTNARATPCRKDSLSKRMTGTQNPKNFSHFKPHILCKQPQMAHRSKCKTIKI